MKKITYTLSFLLLTLFTVSNTYSQCSFDSNDAGIVTDLNFTSNSSAFTTVLEVGNSWTACGNGTLDKISLLATTIGQTATIGVYSGAGNAGVLLGSATATTTTAATSIADRNLVFDFSASSITLTSGGTYTWALISDSFDTRLTNVDIYPGGSGYLATTESVINDFFFKVDIVDDTLGLEDYTSSEKKLQLFPNPSVNYIQISGLTTTEVYTIYNVLGAKVSHGNIANNTQIDTRNITNGLYLLKLKSGSTFPFVKK